MKLERTCQVDILLCQVVLGICLARNSEQAKFTREAHDPSPEGLPQGRDTSSAYYQNLMYVRL